MNENAKRTGLVILVILAIVAAVLSGNKFMAGDQIKVENSWDMGPNHKSEKEMALEAKAKGAQNNATEEKDLSK